MYDLSSLIPITRWYCPRCNVTDVTREAEPHSRFHACPVRGGLTAPLVREGETVKITDNEREDYVGNEDVQRDGVTGRPIMNITTEHADGSTDVIVFAPTAHPGR